MPSGPSQCDMLGESQEVQARCVWTETTGIGKDANTDNMITCGRGGGGQGTCKILCLSVNFLSLN